VCQKQEPKVSRCGRCRIRQFCSKECQVADWSTHKISCCKSDIEGEIKEVESHDILNRRIAMRMCKLLPKLGMASRGFCSKMSLLGNILILQYVGSSVKPSDSELLQEMKTAIRYCEFQQAQVVVAVKGTLLPEPSPIMQAAVQLHHRSLTNNISLEVRSWISKKGKSVNIQTQLVRKV
jgi:hypothetical protein